MSARRSRVEIWTDILAALPRATDEPGGALPTRVQSAANVPHNRFWAYVREMERRGLLTTTPLARTPLGEDFLLQAASLRHFFGASVSPRARRPQARADPRPSR